MDHDVAQTLAALERKLADLERELHTVGNSAPVGGEQRAEPVATVSGPALRETSVPERDAHPLGVLVDEAAGQRVESSLQQRYRMESQETVFGEIPATKDDRESIELADLVRFKDKMQATLQGLIDEYSELLSLKPPADS